MAISSDDIEINIKPYSQFIIDPDNTLSIDDILKLENSNSETFSSFIDKSKVISFGYTDSTIWLRTSIENLQTKQQYLFFDFQYPVIGNITMYHFSQKEKQFEYNEGVMLPTTNRLFKSRSLVLPIKLAPKSHNEVYFKINSPSIIILPARLYSQSIFFEHKFVVDFIMYGILGLYIGFFLFHLITYIDSKELLYLAFCTTTLGRFFYDLYFSGAGQLLFPESTEWNRLGLFYFGGITSAGALWFHAEFLNLRKQSKNMFYFFMGYAGLILIGINYGLLIDTIAFYIITPLLLAMPIILCLSTIPWLRKGYGPAKIYFYGVALTLVSLLWSSLSLSNAVPQVFNLAILSALGYSASFVIVAFSISSRIKDLSKREQQAQLEAQTAKTKDQTKSDFLANMSHEIRTPLNGVLGMIQLLQKSDLKSEQKNWVRIIESSGKNLLNIVNDILDYSKIEAGKLSIEKIPCDVSIIIEECKDVFMLTAKNSRVNLLSHIDNTLPHTVETDPARLRQIIVNLLNNAQKFTEEGEIILSINKLNEDDLYRIAVTDTGIGIDKKEQGKLFKSFEQTRTDIHRKYGGTGLGLAICKQLAELLGGSIGFSSTAGKGSSFWVDIPLHKSEKPTADSSDTAADNEDMTHLRHTNKMSILVAEDNKVNQIVVQNMLKNIGHYSEFVGNGSLAVSKIIKQKDQYDMILMDCDMPIMSGYEATGEIRRFEKEHNLARIPIIALTAHAIDSLKEKSFESGMDDHIAKPLSLEELRRTINKYANARNKKIELAKENKRMRS